MATRVVQVVKTLKDVSEGHRFLKVTEKDGKYTVSRIQIGGYKTIWAKNPDVVYSPDTHLAGTKADIIDYLKSRADKGDDSADDVKMRFESDKRIITNTNVDKHMDWITDMDLKRKKSAGDSVSQRMSLIDRQMIPELLDRVRAVRTLVATGTKGSNTDIIAKYLKIAQESGKIYRVSGCGVDGKRLDNHDLRSTQKSEISSKSTIYLADSGPLSHFCIPSQYDEKRSVTNFMTLYYKHVDGIKGPDAGKKARDFAENLLLPFKKSRGRKTSPSRSSRSASPKTVKPGKADKPRSVSAAPARTASKTPSRSSSVAKARSQSPTKSRSPSVVKSPTKSRSPSVAKSPAQSANTVMSAGSSRAKSPAKSPVKAPVNSDDTVMSAGSSRAARSPMRSPARSPTKSPARSPSPSTTPKQASSRRAFRVPVKK